MISGFLLLDPAKSFDPKTFYRKRLWRVGIPFIFWVGVELLWSWMYAEVTPTPFELFEKVIGVNLSHLYFLVIILELYYLTPYLMAFIKNTTRKLHAYFLYNLFGFTLALSAINALSYEADVITSDNIVTIFLPYVCYYMAGYYLKGVAFKYATSIWMIIAYLALTFATAIASNGDVGAYPRQYGSPLIILMALIGFIYIMRSTHISALANNTVVRSIVMYVSSTIFGIYLTHMLVLNLFDLGFDVVPSSSPSPQWYSVLLKLAVVFTVSFVITAVAKKLPYIRSVFGY